MNYKSIFLTVVLLLGWFACVNEDEGSLIPSVTIPVLTLEIQGLASLKLINSTSDHNPRFVTDDQFTQDNSLSFSKELFGVSNVYHQGFRIQLQKNLPENDRTEFEVNIPTSFLNELSSDQRIVLFAKVYQDICCPLGGDLCASTRISSEFQPPTIENNEPKIHTGIDYAVPVGHPNVAVNDGFVVEAAELPGYGNTVAIRHSNGTTSLYAFLSKLLSVEGETDGIGKLEIFNKEEIININILT
jgi:murein DD-endopeptidase MepM/ murein hydrolase activator NlpD